MRSLTSNLTDCLDTNSQDSLHSQSSQGSLEEYLQGGNMSRRSQGNNNGSSSFNEDYFCCLLCLEPFRNPRLLECQHVFCEHCLQVYYKTFSTVKYEQHGVFLTCPTCRNHSKMPPNGLIGFDLSQANEKMLQLRRKMSTVNMNAVQRCDICIYKPQLEESEYFCSKCSINLCNSCQRMHNNHPLFKNHTVVHISNKETINLICEKHNKLPSIYYCLDCNSPACTVCVFDEHQAHHSVKLRDALSLRREDVRRLLNSLGPRLDKLGARLKKLSHMTSMEMRSRNGIPHSSSESNCPTMEAPVWVKRKTSVFELRREAVKEEQDLQVYYLQLDKIKKLYDHATKTLEMSQSKKLLAVHRDVTSRLASVMEVEVAQIQEAAEAMLEDKQGKVNEILQHMSTNNSSNGSVYNDPFNSTSSNEDSSSDKDVAMFQDDTKSLLIKPKLLWKIEKHKNDPGDLWNPCDITFLQDNLLVVAEYDIINDNNNRLRIYDSVGKTVSMIGQDQIKPLGVATTPEGNIAVTDCKDKRVKIFTPNGQLMHEWGKGQFGWPYGIVLTSKGHYVVSDAFNDVISIHAPDGKRIKQFGSSGPNSSQFRNPYHIAIDARDNIIVSDSGNHCFKVFDINGQYMFKSHEICQERENYFTFESKRKRKRLRAPRGITVDQKGNILIADDNYRVCMFDSQGKYIRNILTEEDSIRFAEALATNNKEGCLAVSEWNPNNMFAVKMFSLYE